MTQWFCPRGCQAFEDGSPPADDRAAAPECGACGSPMQDHDRDFGEVHQAIEDSGIAQFTQAALERARGTRSSDA